MHGNENIGPVTFPYTLDLDPYLDDEGRMPFRLCDVANKGAFHLQQRGIEIEGKLNDWNRLHLSDPSEEIARYKTLGWMVENFGGSSRTLVIDCHNYPLETNSFANNRPFAITIDYKDLDELRRRVAVAWLLGFETIAIGCEDMGRNAAYVIDWFAKDYAASGFIFEFPKNFSLKEYWRDPALDRSIDNLHSMLWALRVSIWEPESTHREDQPDYAVDIHKSFDHLPRLTPSHRTKVLYFSYTDQKSPIRTTVRDFLQDPTKFEL